MSKLLEYQARRKAREDYREDTFQIPELNLLNPESVLYNMTYISEMEIIKREEDQSV